MSAATHLLSETVQSFTQAARELTPLRAGRPVHPTALWRWSRHGINTPRGNIKLETCHLAGRICTSREAVQRFLTSVAEAKSTDHSVINRRDSDAVHFTAQHQVAKSKLDTAGI